MEKIIKIDGRDVKLKATAGFMYRYKSQFGREYLADMIEFEEAAKKAAKEKNVTNKMKYYNFNTMYNIIWALAKTADDTIPPPQEWLDTFDTFPIFQIFGEVKELLDSSGKIDRKNG